MQARDAVGMELELLKGPLDDRRLAAIAGLYGRFNPKYLDPGFCRLVFNENPQGYSLHAFLVAAAGEIVGHYGIVPMDVTVDGRRARSGKGEAFVVHPDHRGDSVTVGDDEPMTCGLAMPLYLYRFAANEGLELVHMLTSPDVGQLHRMTGCRSLHVPFERDSLTLRPGGAHASHPLAPRVLAETALAVAQSVAAGAALALLGLLPGRPRQWTGSAIPSAWLARLEEELRPETGWSLALDVGTLGWLARVGNLQVIALDDAAGDYVLVCPRSDQDRIMEVLLWRQGAKGLRTSLRLLAAVIRSARTSGNGVVTFSSGVTRSAAAFGALRAASRLVGFWGRRSSKTMYVYTADRRFLELSNLRFSPFFYAVF